MAYFRCRQNDGSGGITWQCVKNLLLATVKVQSPSVECHWRFFLNGTCYINPRFTYLLTMYSFIFHFSSFLLLPPQKEAFIR